MNEFFNDSRELYAEHNKGKVTESLVSSDSSISAKYKQLLTNYCSVEVIADGETWLDNESLGHYFHKTVDDEGKVHYISGMYIDAYQAKGHKQFLSDCGLEGKVKLVRVTPQEIKALTL